MKTLKYDVHINFYMRIHDAEIFGGKGSVGYSQKILENCQNFDPAKVKATAQYVIKSTSGVLGISPDKIELISYQEYEEANADKEADDDYENTDSDE